MSTLLLLDVVLAGLSKSALSCFLFWVLFHQKDYTKGKSSKTTAKPEGAEEKAEMSMWDGEKGDEYTVSQQES